MKHFRCCLDTVPGGTSPAGLGGGIGSGGAVDVVAGLVLVMEGSDAVVLELPSRLVPGLHVWRCSSGLLLLPRMLALKECSPRWEHRLPSFPWC